MSWRDHGDDLWVVAGGDSAIGDATITIPYTPPLDWGFLLDYLRKRQTAGVDDVDDERYVRTVEFNGDVGIVTVSNDEHRNRLTVRVDNAVAPYAATVEQRVRRMFDVDIDVEAVRAVLSTDPWLKPFCDLYPGIRVPGAWSAFELLVRTIVGQQVSVSAATTVMGRLVATTGRPLATDREPGRLGPGTAPRKPTGTTASNSLANLNPSLLFPTPEAIAAADLDSIGLPRKRAAALQNVARLIAAGELPFSSDGADVLVGKTNFEQYGRGESVAFEEDFDAIKAALLALPGIGPWTVAYFSLRALGDPDAWPGTDLILRRALDQHPLAGERSAQAISDGWRPYRGYAAVHLWHAATRDGQQRAR